MRGAPRFTLAHDDRSRIIPADAGSTGERLDRMVKKRDHPRGCGEHVNEDECNNEPGGSSPRMRGALISHAQRLRSQGIIPADAGSTCC